MKEPEAISANRIYWACECVERVAGDCEVLHLDDQSYYIKPEADAYIDELKIKIRSLESDLHLADYCHHEEIKPLKAENERLKANIANGDVSRITWIDKYERIYSLLDNLVEKGLINGSAELESARKLLKEY